MYFKKILLILKKTYIIFFISVLFLNFTTSDLKSSIFKVNNIEITEPFEVNFEKDIVINKAFKEAFIKLSKMTVVSNQEQKLTNVKVSEIKNLIDSFNIRDEQFIQNFYVAKFEVNFNKQNTLLFFEKKNVFPSLPSIKNILFLPVLINVGTKKINLYDKNPFYDYWQKDQKDYHLLNYIIPSEDLDLLTILNNNSENLEDYNFEKIITEYGYEDYIICLIYNSSENTKVFSKININKDIKIKSKTYDKVDISNLDSLNELINKIKIIYEDVWKSDNQINRSVKLAINIDVSSKDYEKNLLFENFLKETELVSDFFIKNFNNEVLNYKIIFNGSPNQFLEIIKKKGLNIETGKQVWFLN